MRGSSRLFRVVVLAMAVAVFAAPAAAHGVLQGTSPASGTSVDAPPRQITLAFNEPVDRTFSGAVVLDRAGRRVSSSSTLSPDGRTMMVAAGDLGAGIYTVRWRVLSTLDGHTTGGSFTFAVKVPAPAGVPSSGVPVAQEPVRVIARWIGYVAAVLLAGAAFFQYIVIRPIAAGLPPVRAEALRAASEGRLRRLTVVAALALVASVAVEFVLQTELLLGGGAGGAFSRTVASSFLLDTKAGWSMLTRVSMALIFLLPASPRGRVLRMAGVIWYLVVGIVFVLLTDPSIATGSRHFGHVAVILLVATVYGLASVMAALILPLIPDLRLPDAAWAQPAAGAILLGGITLSSHAAGRGGVAMVIDWTHLLAGAVWVGGLLPLLLILRSAPLDQRRDLAAVLVPRFSDVAGAALGVLVLTGLYSTWINIPALRAFAVTAYGQTLLVKLLLVVPLLALGAVNRFVFRPRLEAGDAGGGARRRFLGSVTAEIVLGAAVLLVVASLTITPPATVSMPAAGRQPVVLAGLAGTTQVRLAIAPGEPGWNRFEVTVTDEKGTIATIDEVRLRTTGLEENLAPHTLRLSAAGQGSYAAEGTALGRSGWWQIEVLVTTGGDEFATAFPLRLDGAAGRMADPRALQLLERARSVMSGIRTWREVEQITNGSGAVVVTYFEAVRPDRLRYRISAGAEAVIIGRTRYQRDGPAESWRQDTLSEPIALGGPFVTYLEKIANASLGRREPCGQERCQVVFWDAQGGDAAFAGWIGMTTFRVHRVLMVAPAHLMTARPEGYDVPLTITPP